MCSHLRYLKKLDVVDEILYVTVIFLWGSTHNRVAIRWQMDMIIQNRIIYRHVPVTFGASNFIKYRCSCAYI